MPNKKSIDSFLSNIIEISILMILFCLPFSKTVVEICSTVAIVAFFAKKIFIERSIKLKVDRKVLIALFLFVLFNAISISNSQYVHLSLRALFSKTLQWVLLFIIVADTIKTPERLRRVFITMVFSVILIMTDAVYQMYFTGIDFLHYPNRYPAFHYYHRFHEPDNMFLVSAYPTASFPFPGDFAAWLNVYFFTFLLVTISKLRKKKNIRILAVALCILLAFFLYLCASQGALVGSVFSVALMLAVYRRKIIRPFVVALVIIIAIISLVPHLRVLFKEEMLDVGASVSDRMNMWSTGWRIFKRHPLIGNGVNTFFQHFREFRTDEFQYKRGSYAHNCFLQMAADIGVFGLAAFLAFAFFVITTSIKNSIKKLSMFRESFVFGLSLGLLAFLAHSFFDTNLYSLNLSALFWLGMGLVAGLGRGANETP
ncbi:MAG: O-antigen ligase family protein [Omnitrophica bacterium]|nr:O-antigen ligase family protein [Candidatus Omnitrophota bacterium]